MSPVLLNVSFLFLCLSGLTEAKVRIIFTEEEAAVRKIPLHGDQAPVQTLLGDQPDTVTIVGSAHVNSFKFQNPMKRQVKNVSRNCEKKDCDFRIGVVHRTKQDKQLFLCGTAGAEESVTCCHMNISDERPTCTASKQTEPIRIHYLPEGAPSALVESGEKADFYVAYSGTENNVGIHKFGERIVRPENHNKEQYYVGLIPIRQGGDSMQDKVYAFYKEKNRDSGLNSEMWFPFVSRVCMADVGGPKNNLQFSWTSQMSARLFCGDPGKKQHFPELVHVATVQADRWQDTRVYALFRNEWGMSAVCVYNMQDIDKVFVTSLFKGFEENTTRPRWCVKDSTKISGENLGIIRKTSEMEDWVRPQHNSGPLLLNHHNYTHIYVDDSQLHRNSGHTVLFLTKNRGGIHKVMHQTNQTFVIAEYPSVTPQDQIISITHDPSSMKLYVTTRRELVQLDVANCASYGDRCEDCVLARDPYCGWNGTHCSSKTRDSLQDVTGGNYTICHTPEKAYRSAHAHPGKGDDCILVPAESKYFLSCPVSSHHAQYSWHHGDNITSSIPNGKQCLLLINNMNHEQEGVYRCVSEEKGFQKELVKVTLRMDNSAMGRSSGPLVWVCLVAVLIRSL